MMLCVVDIGMVMVWCWLGLLCCCRCYVGGDMVLVRVVVLAGVLVCGCVCFGMVLTH